MWLKLSALKFAKMWGKANNDSLAGSLRLFALQTTEGSLDMTAALQTVFFLLLWNERTSSRCVTRNWWQWCEGATQLSAFVLCSCRGVYHDIRLLSSLSMSGLLVSAPGAELMWQRASWGTAVWELRMARAPFRGCWGRGGGIPCGEQR